jgi:predicted kinase
MATAHLIHGFLGAGKTTFACQLERELPAIRFSQDEWMAHLYGNDPPADEFPIFFRRISELIAGLWPRCLELGVDVILDLNFWSREERDETRATASTLGASTALYHLACSDEEAWRRIEPRNRHLNGDLFISRETFEALKARFEPLSDDEENRHPRRSIVNHLRLALSNSIRRNVAFGPFSDFCRGSIVSIIEFEHIWRTTFSRAGC